MYRETTVIGKLAGYVPRAVVVLAILAMVAGCADFRQKMKTLGTSNAEKKAEKLKPTPLLEIENEVVFDRIWTKKIGKGLGKKYVEISPAIVADRVFAADAYGLVVAADRFSGKTIWQTRVGKPDRKMFLDVTDRSDPSFVSGGLGVGQGLVLVGTVRGDVIALNVADGTEKWRTSLNGEVLAPPRVDEDIVAVQTADGKLVALSAEDGERLWVYDTQDPIVTLRGTATPVISDGRVFAGFANGLVASVEVSSGFPEWEQRVALAEGTSELERMVDVDGAPLVTPRYVYAASYQGKTRAIDRRDGSVFWEADEPSFHSLAQGYGLVFIVTDSDEIVAVDQTAASDIWRQEGLLRRHLTDPLAFGNYVIVGDGEGWIHAIAQSDGRFLGRRKIGDPMRSPVVHEDNDIYLLTDKGSLQLLRIRLLQ